LTLIIFLLFFERGASLQRITWLLVLVFLPCIGTVLFVMFGGRFFTKTPRLQRSLELVAGPLRQLFDDQIVFLGQERDNIPYPLMREYFHFIQMNLHHSGSCLLATDTVDVQTVGAEHFASLIADLEAAKTSIYMEYFIFHNDTLGKQIMEILCRKARAGVEVKLIYDDFGSITTPYFFFRQLRRAGGEVISFFPVRWRMPFFINFRNHRKVTVIDSSIGYLGGNNIGDEYANRSAKHKYYWRDTQIRLTGASVAMLKTAFLVDWFGIAEWKKPLNQRTISEEQPNSSADLHAADIKTREQLFTRGIIPTQIIYSAPDDVNREKIKNAFLKMITAAKKYVYIQTPYFIPDEVFLSALKIAAYSGVDVRIMIPGKWDKPYVKAASYGYVRDLLRDGIRFFHYPGFVHAKSIVIDDAISSIGTVNIDTRSFNLHFEVTALFYDTALAEHNRNIFTADEAKCAEAQQNWYDSRHFWVKAGWGFCKLFSPFM
jgi:cardiolipin synthase